MEIEYNKSEFDKAFKMLDDVNGLLSNKAVLENAMKKSLQPLLNDAKATAPVGKTGNLKKQIGARSRKVRRPDRVAAVVNFGSYAPHSHLVKYGTELRRHANGKVVGIMPPNKYFDIAYEKHFKNAQNAMAREIVNEVDRLARKASKSIDVLKNGN